MEFILQNCNEEPSEHLENDNDSNKEKDDSLEKEVDYENNLKAAYLMELKEVLLDQNNQDDLRQVIQNVQHSKKILSDKTSLLNKAENNNNYLMLKMNNENQWRDKIIKRITGINEKLTTVKSITIFVKNLITRCINQQIQFNQVKQQLLHINQENYVKCEQRNGNDNLIKMIEIEKLNKIEFEKHFEIESTDIDNKIEMKKKSINLLKQKIDELKFKNIMAEHKSKSISSKIDSISLEKNVLDLNWEVLKQNLKYKRNATEMDEKINILNDSCERNTYWIMSLESSTDKMKNELTSGNEFLEEMASKISELNKYISDNEEKRILNKTQIENLKLKYQFDKIDIQKKIYTLKLTIRKKQDLIDEKQTQNKILKEELLKMKNKIISAKSNNNKLEIISQNLTDELKEKINHLKKNQKNFESEIKTLKKFIEKNHSNKNIKNELEILENNVTELNEQHEIELYDFNIISKTSEKQMKKDLEVNKLNKTKHLLENEIQKIKEKINEQKQVLKERNKQFEDENEKKFTSFKEQTRIYMNEIMRVSQINEGNFKEKLDNLKKINSDMKIKLFVLKMKKLNLTKDLDMRIEEFNDIQGKKEEKELDNKESENEQNKNEDFCTPATKKAKINRNEDYQCNSSDGDSCSSSIVFAPKKMKKRKRKRKNNRNKAKRLNLNK